MHTYFHDVILTKSELQIQMFHIRQKINIFYTLIFEMTVNQAEIP